MIGVVFDDTRSHRKQRVIATAADILTGMNTSSTLTDDDRAGVDNVAVEYLRAEALCL